MSDIAIKVEDVGKLYRLGEVGTGTLGQDLKRWWAVTRGNEDPFAIIGETNDRTTKGESDFVWALSNINFEVKQGEILGIIGRNGAGKSTLLKLLSKVTQPTKGNIKIKGRIASLLEVGTGFHPDLTGRENVFLNGAILGMTKREIKRKFDEIIDFAGVERYVDTPVKRYSSGMYVRLAFAVAAYLESEILIIDEVLAVGDAEFQKKCIGKIDSVSKGGRTVLFVSHHMGTIAQLCKSAMLMQKGTIVSKGATADVIEMYLSSQLNDRNYYEANVSEVKDKDAFIAYQKMVDKHGRNVSEISSNEFLVIEIKICVQQWQNDREFAISLQHRIKGRIFTLHLPLKDFMSIGEREKTLRLKIPPNIITPNYYSWISALHLPGSHMDDVLWDECSFSIVDAGSDFARYEGMDYGVFKLKDYDIEVLH
jgi:lipopolysaccharide transport system ATP-binding protein